MHETRREDGTARPYTARGQVNCGGVDGTRGYDHGGALKQGAGTCVKGPYMGRAENLVPCNGHARMRSGAEQVTDRQMYGGAVHGTSGDAHGGAV